MLLNNKQILNETVNKIYDFKKKKRVQKSNKEESYLNRKIII
jgi:hypothetical protein